MSVMGCAKISANSFRTQLGMPSGPGALCLLRRFRLMYTQCIDILGNSAPSPVGRRTDVFSQLIG